MAAVFVSGPAEDHLPTVGSLRRAHREVAVLIGGASPEAYGVLAGDGVTIVAARTIGELVRKARQAGAGHVLAVPCPTAFPAAALTPALSVLDEQLSVATVSFLTNAGGQLSFPHLGHPVPHQPEGLDEDAVTTRLRRIGPAQLPAPVPSAEGPAVLVSGYALSAVGHPVDDAGVSPFAAIADFSLRARRRGFVNVVDPSTYVARLFDGSGSEVTAGGADRPWLEDRHPFLACAEQEVTGPESPLGVVHATARSKVLGLRVLLDGSCLGRREMGTQVQTVALIKALAASDDVDRVAVSLATDVPAYAAAALAHPKVDARRAPLADQSTFGGADVVHRPFQPDGQLDVDAWRVVGRRTVLTVLDLISYRSPAYHPSGDVWLSYRRALAGAVGRVDAVVTPSLDVAHQIRTERLPVEGDRLVTSTLGMDHLGGEETATIPPALLERGYVAGPFVLVMGANYAHKNRDIARLTQGELLRRGLDLALVAAGAGVPFGSSRATEARMGSEGAVFVLPDIKAEERNWLLRHASLVLYPTSAEGFGFVPSEAARFGTPTVFVPTGPLGELYGELPVTAQDWSARALADAAQCLLGDPAVARAQVAAVLAASAAYTWDAAAAGLLAVYRSILSMPTRRELPHG